MDKETRAITGELRAALDGDGNKKIIGYAAIFDSRTELWPGFFEQIDRAAFNDVMNDDVRALFNHDANIVLGRTTAGTLKLSVDEKGLRYEITPPDTEQGRNVLESIRRGDISQSSFGFTVKKDSFEDLQDGKVVRTVQKVARLYDISPVTFPAYQDTEVALRNKQDFQKKKHRNDLKAIDIEINSLI